MSDKLCKQNHNNDGNKNHVNSVRLIQSANSNALSNVWWVFMFFLLGQSWWFHIFFAEIAKDHFAELGTHEVIGGIVSPVHDAYGKKGLVSQTHRHAMIKLALETSSWIRISDWESQQEAWSRTRSTLQYHQNYLNSIIRDLNGVNTSNLPNWLPDNVKQLKDPVHIKLLCGADLLESFATPGLWDNDDVSSIFKVLVSINLNRLHNSSKRFSVNMGSLSSREVAAIPSSSSSTPTCSANTDATSR